MLFPAPDYTSGKSAFFDLIPAGKPAYCKLLAIELLWFSHIFESTGLIPQPLKLWVD